MFAGSAWAERRVALVIGADEYRLVRPLENAVNDARAIETALEKLGFEVFVETDRDLRRMRRALEDFREDGAGADVALVFFAGHGIEIAGENRLLPVDADASSLDALKASTLPLEEITETVRAVAPVALVLLDACRNDPFGTEGGGGRGAKALAAAGSPELVAALGRVGRAENVLFAFAAAPGRTASDGHGGNSPFTAALAEHLGAEGVQVGSALKLVQQDVYDRTRGDQLPFIEDGLPQMFFAAGRGDGLPERERLLLAMADISIEVRDEVETVATAHNMPLAPLYAALIGADLANLTLEERSRNLTEAAQAYVDTQDKLASLESDDPEVGRLRTAARDSLRLGALDAAYAYLDQAVIVDRKARMSVGAAFVSRTISEASSLVAKAQVSRIAFDYAAAIAALEEAAALHAGTESLVIPDTARHERNRLLRELGDIYQIVGDSAAALGAYQRMLQAAEKRLANAANIADAQYDLSLAYRMIGGALLRQGGGRSALEPFRASLAIAERFAALDPADHFWQRELSVSHNMIGDVLMVLEDHRSALTSYRAGLVIARRLAAASPKEIMRQHDLSICFNSVGRALAAQGKSERALAFYIEGLAIRMRLAGNDPKNIQRRRDLWISHIWVGDAYQEGGDAGKAEASYRSALSIAARFVAIDPQNAQWQGDLWLSYYGVGNVVRTQGDNAGALASFRKGLAIAERLADIDPRNDAWQRLLAISHRAIGDTLLLQGDGAGALASQRTGLAIRERLAVDDPKSDGRQRDLAFGQGATADALAAQGDKAGALALYRAALVILERLAALDPENTIWRRDLADGQRKVGDVLAIQGDKAGALSFYLAGLALLESLAAVDPNNVNWQRDLAGAQQKVANVLAAQGDQPGALALYLSGLAIHERLAAMKPDNMQWQRDLLAAHQKIAELGGVDAKLHRRKALDIALAIEAATTRTPARRLKPRTDTGATK